MIRPCPACFRVIPLTISKSLERLPDVSTAVPATEVQSAPITHRIKISRLIHTSIVAACSMGPGRRSIAHTYHARGVRAQVRHPLLGAQIRPPLPDGDLFSLILQGITFPTNSSIVQAGWSLCAQIALPVCQAHCPMEQTAASAHSATADLEGLLAMHEQTVNAQAERLELIVQGSQIGTWIGTFPAGASRSTNAGPACSGIISTNFEPHVRAWKPSYTPDDMPDVMAAVSPTFVETR